MLRLATQEDVGFVTGLINKHRYWFPAVRNNKIPAIIDKGNCVVDRELGGFITFVQYKTAISVCEGHKAKAGDVMIHQVAVEEPNQGNGRKLYEQFRAMFPDCTIWGKIREDNVLSWTVAEKFGREHVGFKNSKHKIIKVYKWN